MRAATAIATTGFVAAAIAAKKVINLTDKRVEILRWLAAQPNPVFVSGIAHVCMPRGSYSSRDERHTVKLQYTGQMATRAGAGAAIPLIKAGLVMYCNYAYGWGQVSISSEGRSVLAAFERDDGTLQGELERAKTIGDSRKHRWVGK